MSLVAQGELQELLSYDPDTGSFRWRKDVSAKAKASCIAGSVGGGGRLYIGIRQTRYHAHRLAWLYVYGEWPSGGVEHINGDRLDNRIRNLRVSSKSARDLTAQRLKDLLRYCPDTGEFTAAKARRGLRKVGSAGWVNAQGYRCVSLDGSTYLAHRLAWLFVNGEWPLDQIDHINGVRSDNRISNLRASSQHQNMQNTSARSDSSTGLKGVFPVRSGKWAAQIQANKKVHHLGTFASKEEAFAAYQSAASDLHGEFAKF